MIARGGGPHTSVDARPKGQQNRHETGRSYLGVEEEVSSGVAQADEEVGDPITITDAGHVAEDHL